MILDVVDEMTEHKIGFHHDDRLITIATVAFHAGVFCPISGKIDRSLNPDRSSAISLSILLAVLLVPLVLSFILAVISVLRRKEQDSLVRLAVELYYPTIIGFSVLGVMLYKVLLVLVGLF